MEKYSKLTLKLTLEFMAREIKTHNSGDDELTKVV
jgi:hypothetical protein